ncbi:MAG: hypothetical protein ABFC84_16885 [Veillonellales bacterium]
MKNKKPIVYNHGISAKEQISILLSDFYISIGGSDDKNFKNRFNKNLEKYTEKFCKVINENPYERYYTAIGVEICHAISEAFSHPYLKVDMCPEFSNMLILTYGRFIYKFLSSKRGKKLWKELDKKGGGNGHITGY